MSGGGLREGAFSGRSPAGPHRVAYLEWGRPDAPATVVCVHGLTGHGLDFEVLAPALADAGYRVVCPDVVGRGESDWLSDPAGYELRQYVSDMGALLSHLDAPRVDWVGTSMGGLIGMAMAAASPSPIRRLVINDIGPFVPAAAIQRLDSYVGDVHDFADLDAVEAYFRVNYAPLGDLSHAQWRRLAERRVRPREGGGYRLHYDPAVSINLHATSDRPTSLWPLWDAIRCPVLVLRGARSDLLRPETAEEMRVRGPRAEVIEFPGCGHPPALLDPSQIDPVVTWLGPPQIPG